MPSFLPCPSGTRIIYDRKFLLQCRTSPLTRTPPKMPDIPGVTRPLRPESSLDAVKPEQTPVNRGERKLHADESAGTAFLESPENPRRSVPVFRLSSSVCLCFQMMPSLKWTCEDDGESDQRLCYCLFTVGKGEEGHMVNG